MSTGIEIYLEVGEKKVFACAVDWPGWSRGGKTENEALDTLLSSGQRYADVAKRAKVAFRSPTTVEDFEAIARVKGDASTEFGIPGQAAPGDEKDLTPADLKRWRSLLRAAWATWDQHAVGAKGVTLAVGPRGGGRSLAKMTHHVFEADQAYLRQLGSKPPVGEDMAILREACLEALRARAKSETPPNPNQVKKLWSPRYYVRRSAWHALDHAWELADRSLAS